jgi:hypothetical protein
MALCFAECHLANINAIGTLSTGYKDEMSRSLYGSKRRPDSQIKVADSHRLHGGTFLILSMICPTFSLFPQCKKETSTVTLSFQDQVRFFTMNNIRLEVDARSTFCDWVGPAELR